VDAWQGAGGEEERLGCVYLETSVKELFVWKRELTREFDHAAGNASVQLWALPLYRIPYFMEPTGGLWYM